MPPTGKSMSPGKPFPKGKSGNPGGKPKKYREIEQLAQLVLEKGKENLAIKGLLDIAQKAKQDRDRLRALELLMAYAYGKPRQRVELGSDEESGPLNIIVSYVDPK